MHGKGRMIDTENGVYIGEWNFGQKHGKGTMTYWNGNKYEGEWKDDQRSGYGILDEGETHYEGNFENGLQSGYGEQIFMDGPIIKNDLDLRKYQWMGPEFTPGWKYSGNFLNGKRWGSGVIEKRGLGLSGVNKMKFETNFENNLPVSEYKLHTINLYTSWGVWKGFKFTNYADEIIAGLFLGSAKAATNKEWLAEAHIESIVRVLDKENVEVLPGITYYEIKLKDKETEDLTQNLDEALKFISNAHFRHNVLVHCYAGISRSTSIVIAFLMVEMKLSFSLAYWMVKSQRECIHPNKGFIKQLKLLKTKIMKS